MNELPKRKPLRLENYDYSQNGYYFITICTKDRQSLFWQFAKADITHPNLSEYGKIADEAINAIPSHYSYAKIDKYVIMPDHIHLMLVISNEENGGRMISPPTKPIATIIGQMKRWVSKKIGFPIWQKSYYEHIIRDDNDYIKKAEYILNNPTKRGLM